MTIFTIGHSNYSLETFIDALERHGIRTLADIRSFPSSRHNPQFNQDSLRAAVEARGIGYEWVSELGGRRHNVSAASPHTGLRHASFRSYADYMQTPGFHQGIDKLLRLKQPVACMCAEAVYWRCHRRLVSDYLTFTGVEIQHIQVGSPRLVGHRLTDPCRWDDHNVIYAATEP